MFKLRVLCLVSCTLVFAFAAPINVKKGEAKNLRGNALEEAERILDDSLLKLTAAVDGPHYTIIKVNSATLQTVSGSIYKYNADLRNQSKEKRNCNISIWSRPWLEYSVEVTINCEGEKEIVKKHKA